MIVLVFFARVQEVFQEVEEKLVRQGQRYSVHFHDSCLLDLSTVCCFQGAEGPPGPAGLRGPPVCCREGIICVMAAMFVCLFVCVNLGLCWRTWSEGGERIKG